MSRAKPPILVVLKAHFRANRRKTGILAVLAVVMMVVYGRMFFKSGGPSPAGASVVVADPAPANTSTSAGSRPAKVTPRVTLSDPVPAGVSRDPFVVDLDKFARAPGESAIPAQTIEIVEGDPHAEIRAAADELELQAISYGESPLACISGQLVLPGQEIAGFVVSSVEPMRVVLRRGSIEVALNLR